MVAQFVTGAQSWSHSHHFVGNFENYGTANCHGVSKKLVVEYYERAFSSN